MKFSTSAEYGLRALIHLAEQPNDRPYPLSEIAKNQAISLSYLEKIFLKLKASGIVTAQKGSKGGYMLAKPVEELSVKEIFEALEGSLAPYQPLIDQHNAPKLHCKSHLAMAVIQHQLFQSLNNITLAKIINQ